MNNAVDTNPRSLGSLRSKIAGWAAGIALALSPALLAAAPADQDVFTDFEGISTEYGVPFQVGPSGSRVEFGGNARSLNVGSGALSGTQAWVVQNAAANGTITFIDAPASQVEFFATAGSNPFGMIIRAYDPSNTQIGSPSFPGSAWEVVSFTGPVARIEVSNGAAGDLVYIDDFGFSTSGGPAVPLLDLRGIAVLLAALTLSGWFLMRATRRAA